MTDNRRKKESRNVHEPTLCKIYLYTVTMQPIVWYTTLTKDFRKMEIDVCDFLSCLLF